MISVTHNERLKHALQRARSSRGGCKRGLMRIAPFVGPLLGALLLVSCIRSSSVAPQGEQQSLEQRLADLEQQFNGGAPGAPRLSEAEARRQYEHDLAEIQGMGLVERAQHDFSSRLTNATIDKWTIGYFMHTNTVWCDVRYRLPGGNETLQREFGYARKDGTNWSLIWGAQ